MLISAIVRTVAAFPIILTDFPKNLPVVSILSHPFSTIFDKFL
ncbi:hypothetical protein TH70_0132 [Streptococcus agalactiae]|nr:hypothetical protein TH70_0132 [Streptococcus agalactiae]